VPTTESSLFDSPPPVFGWTNRDPVFLCAAKKNTKPEILSPEVAGRRRPELARRKDKKINCSRFQSYVPVNFYREDERKVKKRVRMVAESTWTVLSFYKGKMAFFIGLKKWWQKPFEHAKK
jgi:hypothetical protein